MTIEQFEAKIPFQIIHSSHGALERKIVINKEGEIIVNYMKYNSQTNIFDTTSKGSTYGTVGKSFEEVFESLYPFLIEEGHIKV